MSERSNNLCVSKSPSVPGNPSVDLPTAAPAGLQGKSLQRGSFLLKSSVFCRYFLELSRLRVLTFQCLVKLGAEPSAKLGVGGESPWELGRSWLLPGDVWWPCGANPAFSMDTQHPPPPHQLELGS